MSIFTVFLKNGNFISKIKRSKVTDYAALDYELTCCMEKSVDPDKLVSDLDPTCTLFSIGVYTWARI